MHASYDRAVYYVNTYHEQPAYLVEIDVASDEGYGLVINGEVAMHVNHDTAERLVVSHQLRIKQHFENHF